MKKLKNKRTCKRKKKIIKPKEQHKRMLWRDLNQLIRTIENLITETANGFRMYTTMPLSGELTDAEKSLVHSGALALSDGRQRLTAIAELELPAKRGPVRDHEVSTFLNLHTVISDVHEMVMHDAVGALGELAVVIDRVESKAGDAETPVVDDDVELLSDEEIVNE